MIFVDLDFVWLLKLAQKQMRVEKWSDLEGFSFKNPKRWLAETIETQILTVLLLQPHLRKQKNIGKNREIFSNSEDWFVSEAYAITSSKRWRNCEMSELINAKKTVREAGSWFLVGRYIDFTTFHLQKNLYHIIISRFSWSIPTFLRHL